MSFADLEQRVNAAAMRRLSNARAQRVGDSEDFPVIFDRAFVEVALGAGAYRPTASAQDSDIAGFASDETQLVINGSTYVVRDLQPDGTGWTLMILEAA